MREHAIKSKATWRIAEKLPLETMLPNELFITHGVRNENEEKSVNYDCTD